MPLANPDRAAQSLTDALIAVEKNARAIRTQGGDLPISQINDILKLGANLTSARDAAQEAAQVNAPLMLQILNDRGVLGNLPQIAAGVDTVVNASTAMEPVILAAIDASTPRQLLDFFTLNAGAASVRQMRGAQALPAAVAPGIRDSAELAALIAALEALGA